MLHAAARAAMPLQPQDGSARDLAAPLQVESGAQPGDDGQTALRRAPTLAGEFNYEPPETLPYPAPIRWVRRHIFRIFLAATFGGVGVYLFIASFFVEHDRLMERARYASIPLVSILFTWWHVWLGIKMCFYPIEFVGCCKPVLGWQGIVPRRAGTMARRSCDIMIGTLITVEEIIDRIEPDDFFENLENVMGETSAAVLGRLANRYWPNLWKEIPDTVKRELQNKVLDESKLMFNPVVQDLKENVSRIVDIKQMAIDVLVSNKPLLVEMFQKIGEREFTFIQHVSAVMGFVLGVIQMLLWIVIRSRGPGSSWAGYVILPVSGLIIGYFTNWLGITMIFRPVQPHIVCGGYVNIQGVFLKRQQQVSQELTTMICTHLVHARKMMEYIVQKADTMHAVLEIYQKHMSQAIDDVMGRGRHVMPIFVGQGAIEGMKQDVIKETLEELPSHSAEIESYMDRTFALRDTLAYRLSRLPPEMFEGMLHPVFQEDEWMVLMLGGVLGVTVGLLQAFFLGA